MLTPGTGRPPTRPGVVQPSWVVRPAPGLHRQQRGDRLAGQFGPRDGVGEGSFDSQTFEADASSSTFVKWNDDPLRVAQAHPNRPQCRSHEVLPRTAFVTASLVLQENFILAMEHHQRALCRRRL